MIPHIDYLKIYKALQTLYGLLKKKNNLCCEKNKKKLIN